MPEPEPTPQWNEEVYQAQKEAAVAMREMDAQVTAGTGVDAVAAGLEAIACQLDLANKMTFAAMRRDRVF